MSTLIACGGGNNSDNGGGGGGGGVGGSGNDNCTDSEFNEDVENLRDILLKQHIIRFDIKRMQLSAGSNSGDNYMSIVKRLHVVGGSNNNSGDGSDDDSSSRDDGNVHATTTGMPQATPHTTAAQTKESLHEMSLIIKRQIPSLSRRQLFHCDEAFRNEINAYSHIVPLLEQHSTAPVFPRCYYAGRDAYGELIMLEDLKQSSFHMQNRLTELSLHYCQLVMKQLAQLHAASIAAKQLNSRTFREKCKHICDIVYGKEAEEFYKNILDAAVQESLNSLRASNVDGCLTEPIRLIEKLQDKLFHYLQDRISNSKECLSVVCHGDLWVNNIMFQAAEATTTTTTTSPASTSTETSVVNDKVSPPPAHSVRFFDLQAMRYTSPVFDILHFIYTSTKRDLRETCTNQLLETYCLALAAHLEEQLGGVQQQTAADPQRVVLGDVYNVFSLPNITREYYEQILYGLAIAMWVLPAITFDPKHIPNLDELSELQTNAKELKCTQMLTPEYHERLKELVLEFYQNGYLDSCGGGGGDGGDDDEQL